jgi:hypothetical protein
METRRGRCSWISLMLRRYLLSALFKKCNGVASALADLLFDEFGRVVPIQCIFLPTMKRTSDTLDLLSTMIYGCPLRVDVWSESRRGEAPTNCL